MSLRSYIEKFDAVNLGMLLILLIPFLFILFYSLSNYANSNLIFYIGLYICGVLTFLPLRILTVFLLLIINPAKYKEYEMKKIRKKKEDERKIYFLILLNVLWNQPSNLQKSENK